MASDGIPDYMKDANAVFNDSGAEWRYGDRAPDYSKVNKTYDDEKTSDWAEGSLEWMVSNLVKNWEKEASHKIRGDQWRTVDPNLYRFQTNGGPWHNVDDMLRLGTYSALIEDSELYSAEKNTFSDSHKSFKRSLRTFAWEVLQVYGSSPNVAIKWRHWGKMTGKFSCIAKNGEKLEADPTNEIVEVFGITTAKLDEQFRILELETYWNPDSMLKQLTGNSVTEIASHGSCPGSHGSCPGSHGSSPGKVSSE